MNTKRFPTKREYELWIDQPEAVVETLDYMSKSTNEDVQKPNLQETDKTLTTCGKSKDNINPKNHFEKVS
jgi:Sec7-like guanine-nucleotide exchange factor